MLTFLSIVKVSACLGARILAWVDNDEERARFSALFLFWYALPIVLIGDYRADSVYWWWLFAGWDLTIASHFMTRPATPLRNFMVIALVYCAAINLLIYPFKFYFFFDNYLVAIQMGALAQCFALVLASSKPVVYNFSDWIKVHYCEPSNK